MVAKHDPSAESSELPSERTSPSFLSSVVLPLRKRHCAAMNAEGVKSLIENLVPAIVTTQIAAWVQKIQTLTESLCTFRLEWSDQNKNYSEQISELSKMVVKSTERLNSLDDRFMILGGQVDIIENRIGSFASAVDSWTATS